MPSAASLGVPLYEYLGGAEATLLPMPQIQIFGGGAHAGRRVDIQDFMVVCPGATSFAAGARVDGRGLPPRRPADAGARAAARRRRRGRLVARLRDQRAGARDAGAGDRARRLRARRAGRDRARHRRLRVRPRRPLHARPRIARARFRRHDRAAAALDRQVPDRLDRGPAGRGRPAGLRPLHPGRGRAPADRRRRLPGVRRGAGARGRGASARPTRCCSSRTSAAR